jgi:nucleotide-binding universal stress UspA family protein
MKRIVLPLDGSPVAESVLPVVADLARAGGASVRLLRVMPLPNNCEDADGRVIAYADQEMERLEAEARDYLRTVETRPAGFRSSRACALVTRSTRSSRRPTLLAPI